MSQPERPSHFRETPEQRTEMEPAPDYVSLPTDMYEGEYGIQAAPEPMPVIIVDPPPTVTRHKRWSAGTFTLDDSKHWQLADQSRKHRRMLIRNLDDTDPVFLVNGPTVPDYLGYELPAGTEVELTTNWQVWAVLSSGDSARVSVLVEEDLDETT